MSVLLTILSSVFSITTLHLYLPLYLYLQMYLHFYLPIISCIWYSTTFLCQSSGMSWPLTWAHLAHSAPYAFRKMIDLYLYLYEPAGLSSNITCICAWVQKDIHICLTTKCTIHCFQIKRFQLFNMQYSLVALQDVWCTQCWVNTIDIVYSFDDLILLVAAIKN